MLQQRERSNEWIFLEFETIKRTILSTKLADNDKIVFLAPVDSDLVVLITNQRRILKFPVQEVTILKKASVGVRAMKLEQEEEIQVVYCLNNDEKKTVLIGRKKSRLIQTSFKETRW